MSDSEITSNLPGSHRISTSGDVELNTYLEIAEEQAGQKPVPIEQYASVIKKESIIVIDFKRIIKKKLYRNF